MFIMCHILSRHVDIRDRFNCLGRLYPDVFIVSPRLPYSVTHFTGVVSLRAFLRMAAVRGPDVYSFASGVAQHVSDDQRLALLARQLKVDAAGLSFIAQEAINFPIDSTPIQNALLVPIAAGLIECAVARRNTVDLGSLAGLETLLSDGRIVGFVADYWQMNRSDIRRIHSRWSVSLAQLPWHDPAELARQELVHYWPRYASNHLRNAGLLTTREAIHVRRKLESAREPLIEAMLYCSQRIDPGLIN